MQRQEAGSWSERETETHENVAASQSQAAAPGGAVSAGEAPGKYLGHAACVCVASRAV